ncbi:hypothetical protein [Profundibacter sp.]
MGKSLLLAAVAALAVTGAEAQGFDPEQPCTDILRDADETTLAMVGAWTSGYLASQQSDARPVDLANVRVILGNLGKACKPGKSLLDLVGGSSKQDAGPAAGSEAEARALLMRFFDPNEDLVALTGALLPKPEDVRAVYSDPLASKMIETYAAALKPGIKFGPKPEHDDLYMVYTTTAKLVAGDPVMDEFPGGYRKVVQYFKADVPIVRFKFVRKGETSGLAFDGLVFVNDHWVLLPKPWRSLD